MLLKPLMKTDMHKPKLFVFSISHFCEKTEWALDYLQVDYQLERLLPGPHMQNASRLGLKRGSLPILQTPDAVIQGSEEIIDWAESVSSNKNLTLKPSMEEDLAKQLEHRLGEGLGVHVRRAFYSEALIEHTAGVKKVFSYKQPLLAKIKLHLSWPMVRKLMIKRMDLGYEQGLESIEILEQELDWLDEQLADGRQYLDNIGFSRLDITAASLLARIVSPSQFPHDDGFVLPPRIQKVANGWKSRPSLQWVENLYRQHR